MRAIHSGFGVLCGSLLLWCIGTSALAQTAPPADVEQVQRILAQNAQARGGVQEWQRIRSMVWVGHVEMANRPDQNLPFMLEQKRPASSRFEIISGGQKSVRTYNGRDGWKMRSNGLSKPELQPFSEDEAHFAHDTPVIDGVLMDYAAKGYPMGLAGTDRGV